MQQGQCPSHPGAVTWRSRRGGARRAPEPVASLSLSPPGVLSLNSAQNRCWLRAHTAPRGSHRAARAQLAPVAATARHQDVPRGSPGAETPDLPLVRATSLLPPPAPGATPRGALGACRELRTHGRSLPQGSVHRGSAVTGDTPRDTPGGGFPLPWGTGRRLRAAPRLPGARGQLCALPDSQPYRDSLVSRQPRYPE